MKIEEVLAKMTDIQHKLAVYSEVLDHLETYLPSDVDEVSEITILEGCLVPKVSQRSIEAVLEAIQELYEKEKEELGALSSLEAKSNGSKRKPTTRKPATWNKS